ncbi:hypothetical protein EXN66_Car000057 [Channa argus]|uniref:Uncharacterized protein n=2 Tax=Channa argus TaxID=215402 RepID=A0A6G1QXT7_CHAAH|nr:hypothetical protein EXN66_Car000057 [Channa argus]
MDQFEDREEVVLPSKPALCGEHEGQTKDQRPDSPEPSCVSMESDESTNIPSSLKDEQPADERCEDREEVVLPSKPALCGEHEGQTKDQRPDSPEPSCVSMESDESTNIPSSLKDEQPADER